MTTTDTRVTVRKATGDDASVILSLVDALAAYEKLEPPDAHAKERLIGDMTGVRPRFDAYLAKVGGKGVGYAFVFETYSSFLALPTLYLEDLFVLPEYRKKRIGYTLFAAMVKEAHRRGCGRMEWAVLDWNQPAIDFYKRIGATHLKQWQLYRLTQAEIGTITAAGPAPSA